MIIIACVDDNLGLLFNNRRQSRDGILIKDILDFIGNKILWINTYSKQLFPEQENIIVSENFIDEANEGDFCFIEDIDVKKYVDKIEKIILYFWNREYPADRKFDINLDDWILTHEKDFEGSSHEKITQKIYIRRNEGWEEVIKQKRKLKHKPGLRFRSLL